MARCAVFWMYRSSYARRRRRNHSRFRQSRGGRIAGSGSPSAPHSSRIPQIARCCRRTPTRLGIASRFPDFHLRVARRLHARNIPVAYLVAPQVWAWRKGRIPSIRRLVRHLLCIFPFEQEFFTRHGVTATYIGHPMVGRVRPSLSRDAFFRKHGFDLNRPMVAVLPGSRRGESARHLPALLDAVGRLGREHALNFALPASATTGAEFFRERIGKAPSG